MSSNTWSYRRARITLNLLLGWMLTSVLTVAVGIALMVGSAIFG